MYINKIQIYIYNIIIQSSAKLTQGPSEPHLDAIHQPQLGNQCRGHDAYLSDVWNGDVV